MSTHPALQWPRTDQDTSRYPEVTPPREDDWYYENVPSSDPKYKQYETKTAEHLVKTLNLPVDASKQSIPMPPGYKLFAHRRRQPGGDIRTDYYLYGSKHTQKFRSVPEFLDHAAWLFDTSRPLDDHTTCTCKYSKGSGGHKRTSLPGSSKRSAETPIKDGSAKKKRAARAEEDDEGLPAVVPERAEELRTQRRFRRGELVWFQIEAVQPPLKDGLSPITHWPGLISNTVLRSKVLNADDTASASASSAWTVFGGTVPEHLKTAPKRIHFYEYNVRPLGMFSPHDQVVDDGNKLLPWAVGNELLGGEHGWDKMGDQAEEILVQGVKEEAARERAKSPEEVEKSFGSGWKGHWAKRIKFADMPKVWGSAVFRLSLALKTAASITKSWSQTDKIDVLPEEIDISAEDIKAIQEQRKTLYQGLWWGGERIWLEDIVRLKKLRADLPSDVLLPPSPGALERGVFLKIRVLAIERVTEGIASDTTGWRCMLYGDLYELAEEGYDGVGPAPLLLPAVQGALQDVPIVPAYQAAKGYKYRQLNDPGSEVTCDVIDVAGRVYPDLLDGTTQNWFVDPMKRTDTNNRAQPGESALALVGLRPGSTVASKSTQWNEDLYSIVLKSTKETEATMKDYYVSLLRKELNLPVSATAGGQ
ncbi:hypothetical protein IAU60_002679 [Kwoniella sp. DSM 27419]